MDKRLLNSFKLQAKKEKFSKESIKRLEKYFSISLDKEYKDFLLNFGSVTIEAGYPDSFLVKYEKEDRTEDILNFLSEKEIIEAYTILRTVNIYEGEAQIPDYFIPIAHTNEPFLRNYILLHKKEGTVWLTIEDESLESKPETFGWIANGVSEFLNKIEMYTKTGVLTNKQAISAKNSIVLPEDFMK